eukprot:jgi/Botrbrau1/21244/Bobra.39_2s0040.3
MAGKLDGIVSFLVVFSIVVAFCGWFTQMAGLSALQYNCNALVSRGGTIPFATWTQLPAGQTCGTIYRWLWWIFAYEFPVLVALLFAMSKREVGLWMGVVASLGVATALQMWGANVGLNMITVFTGGYARARARAVFAGFLLTALGNAVLLYLAPMKHLGTAPT